MKPRLTKLQIQWLNQILESAILYGGDLGGAYCTDKFLPELIHNVQIFLMTFDGKYSIKIDEWKFLSVEVEDSVSEMV